MHINFGPCVINPSHKNKHFYGTLKSFAQCATKINNQQQVWTPQNKKLKIIAEKPKQSHKY